MSHRDERVVFDNTVHGLFRIALQEKLSLQARHALREVGLDLDGKLQPAYPLPLWMRCLDIAVQDSFPDLDREEAYRQLGQLLVLRASEAVLGRGMLAFGRALGPRRLLLRMNHHFRNADNFIQAHITELSPTSFEVRLDESLGLPSYYQGILEASLGAAGAHRPTVRCVQAQGTSCTYVVTWQPYAILPLRDSTVMHAAS
jgi:uncharacterized protein (TIGR02265 family)